jgi:hypothetical protein
MEAPRPFAVRQGKVPTVVANGGRKTLQTSRQGSVCEHGSEVFLPSGAPLNEPVTAV